MLAKDPDQRSRYAYGQGSDGMAAVAARMAEVCQQYGVTLRDVALQFSLRNPNVHSTALGASRRSRVADAIKEVEIPDGVWDVLDALAPEQSTWLG